MSDSFEFENDLNPIDPSDAYIDSDGDGLTNFEEQKNRTDPRNPDSDGDGLSDGQEIDLGTDPNNEDTDGDGLTDGEEIELGTDPNNKETDGDGVPDGEEVENGSDPNDPNDRGDIDNSDPTFIQKSRKKDVNSNELIYQFSPTSSPGIKDMLTIEYHLTYPSLVTAMIYSYQGDNVKTLINTEFQNEGKNVVVWIGRDDSDNFVEDGIYIYIIRKLSTLDSNVSTSITGEIIVDNEPPEAKIELIKVNTTQYGDYSFIGTASDEHIDHYNIELLHGETVIKDIQFNNTSVKEDHLGVMNLKSFIINKQHSYVGLSVQDLAGNITRIHRPLVKSTLSNIVKINIDSRPLEFTLIFYTFFWTLIKLTTTIYSGS